MRWDLLTLNCINIILFYVNVLSFNLEVYDFYRSVRKEVISSSLYVSLGRYSVLDKVRDPYLILFVGWE